MDARIAFANLRAYVTYGAGGMGKIKRSMEFQGKHGPAQMPADTEPSGNHQRCVLRRASIPAHHWHFYCPHWS